MKKLENKKVALDRNTKQYIKRIRILQLFTLVLMCSAFTIFAHNAVLNNRESLSQVALEQVQESMYETINNITIHIDAIRMRMTNEAEAYMQDMAMRMEKNGVARVNDVLAETVVCGDNKLGLAVQAFYTDADGTLYHLKAVDRMISRAEEAEKQTLLECAAVINEFEINGQQIVLFISQKQIDELAKEEIHDYIHSEYYEGNQYVWVNEVLNIEGGDNYAIRRIHPNLIESEGQYLSTSMQDMVGNYPYLTELEGIRAEGHIFQSYYFKNKVDDEITEKFSYSQYYEPFNWIVATGETLEEVYDYASDLNERNFRQIISLMAIFIILFVVIFTIMINILEKQARTYRGQLMKQAQVLEDMYTTMSVGLLRIRLSDTESTVVKINPKALELLGVASEEEFVLRRRNHIVDTIDEEDAEKLVATYQELKEQWDNVVVECRVKWKDGSVHLLRIRSTLVEFDGNAKIIQRMCQDITEERRLQEEALFKAEEKATLDPMTQIKNKRAIELITRARIKEASEQNLPIAVGFVDIDNFRDYNTKYGHMQGDEVIKYVAATLKESVEGDVGRTGGDEFTFCILNASYDDVEASMKAMCKRLNEGIAILETGEVIPTPCSIGVVIERGTSLDYEEILKHSDEAMYQAKERGKNTYQILRS